ncbi:TPA: hypothetical protein DDW35_08185 [Candidatus Sumerlaeota bacterium]|jgi:lysozyme family protein|nr:hypothetical protein [Candidatus Sumerlaeota bacterium]
MRENAKQYYLDLWNTMQLRPECMDTINGYVKKLLRFKERYEAVEEKTGVPWYVIGVIHGMEAGFDFAGYLGNGDPWNKTSTHEPEGRGPFDSWEEGAVDALTMPQIRDAEPTEWNISGIAYYLESYNGWGYADQNINSAYLWSFSQHYTSGKYIADRVWSDTAISDQCGAMVQLKRLLELRPDIKIPEATI